MVSNWTALNELLDSGEQSGQGAGAGNWSETCYHEPVTKLRLVLVVCLGTPLATAGIVTNALLVGLLGRPRYRKSPMLYLAYLAGLDVTVCTTYIFLFTFDAVGLYFHIEPLWRLWHSYVMGLLTLSRVTQLASTYMVLCATIERFLMVYEVSWPVVSALRTPIGRQMVIVGIFVCSLALRLPTFFEWRIVPNPDCGPFEDLTFIPGIVTSTFYADTFQVYIMQSVQLFIPFVSLCLLNVVIVTKMRQNFARQQTEERMSRILHETSMKAAQREAEDLRMSFAAAAVDSPPTPTAFSPASDVSRSPSQSSTSLQKQRLKAATYTMVAIVTSYLACNSLDMAVKTMEKIDMSALQPAGKPTAFYTISTDIISLNFMFNSFLRLFIYLACNKDLRQDFARFYGSYLRCHRPPVSGRTDRREAPTSKETSVRDSAVRFSVHKDSRLVANGSSRKLTPRGGGYEAMRESKASNGSQSYREAYAAADAPASPSELQMFVYTL